MEKDEKGKTQIVPIGFQPICSKDMPYELTVSFLLSADKPGYPIPMKLQEQHKAMFPLDQLLDEKSGQRIAEWAKGDSPAPKAQNADDGNLIGDGERVYAEVFKAWKSATETDDTNRKAAYGKLTEYIGRPISNHDDLKMLTVAECKTIREKEKEAA
jgi:hypothetical protein